MPLVAAIVSGVAYAVLGTLYKGVTATGARLYAFLGVFMGIGAIVTGICTAFHPTTWGDPRLYLFGLGGGMLTVVSIQSVIRASGLGPASIVWTISNLALILPVALSPLLFHEPLTLVDFGTLALFAVMLSLFAQNLRTQGEIHAGNLAVFIGLLALAFCADGFNMVAIKYKELCFGVANSAAIPMLSFALGACFARGMYLRTYGAVPLSRAEWVLGAGAGLACSVGILGLFGAMSLPVVIALPVVKGLSLGGAVLLYFVLFRERCLPLKLVGLTLGALVLALSIFRDRIIQAIGF